MSMKISIFAVFCFSMLIVVKSESTSDMRIRLHNLVEEYVAVHDGSFKDKICAFKKLPQALKTKFGCAKKHMSLDETAVHDRPFKAKICAFKKLPEALKTKFGCNKK